MKKIFVSLFSVFALGVLFCGIVSAQTPTQGTVVATVNLYNAKIVSQTDRDFVISFDISNRVGAQPMIKYGIRLTQLIAKNESTIDEKVYDDVISLGENSTISKSVKYSIPASISAGSYSIWIESKNESGLPLGVAFAGQVQVEKNISNTIEIVPASCYLATAEKQYLVGQWAVITSAEALTAKCKVVSDFSTDTILIPTFITRSHTSFGEIVTTSGSSTGKVTIKKGTNDVAFILPLASKSQDYNLAISLASSDKKIISNTVSLNYILSGQSGTIKNVVFDKTFYKAGENAKLQIFSTQTGTSTITAIVLDGKGVYCSATTSKEISNFSITTLVIPITKNCTNPKANIVLSTGNTLLDSNDFQVTTVTDSTTSSSMISSALGRTILVLILAVLVLIFGFAIYRKKYSVIK